MKGYKIMVNMPGKLAIFEKILSLGSLWFRNSCNFVRL